MSPTRLFAVALLAVGGLTVAPAAQAAESYDNCNNFIDSLPATISTQGVWCLRADIATNIASGSAITIAKNNVTIDCNDFKIGGLAAGNSSSATGISSSNRQNTTIRNCGVRGFNTGIQVTDGAGHLIEDNRLDYNLVEGIRVSHYPSNSVIRNNRIYDTGGHPSDGARYGIYIYAGDSIDVINNVIAGVYGTVGQENGVTGIHRHSYASGLNMAISTITGNTISSLVAAGTGETTGFYYSNAGNTSGRVAFTGNHILSNVSQPGSLGMRCFYPKNVIARDNTVTGFATNLDSECYDAGGNVTF